MATQSSPTLYDRLGGVYSIATVIDDFIDPIMVVPRLNANQLVEEPARFPPRCKSARLRREKSRSRSRLIVPTGVDIRIRL